jgi:two-component system NtrC family sensor kinase
MSTGTPEGHFEIVSESVPKKGSLRRRIMTSVGAMVVLSLLSSTFSLYRITEVNRLLEAINHVSVPLGRLFVQMESDAEVFHRELERNLGDTHWKDPHWKPKPAPQWIEDVLNNEMGRVKALIASELEWTSPEGRQHWQEWVSQISNDLEKLNSEATRIYQVLVKKDDLAAAELYPKWIANIEAWKRQLQWGASEYERSLRQNFSTAENRVAELRTGLEMILVIVVLMSLLLLWLGERALRPLVELTHLARQITRRGLRKADKSLLPEIPISRSDEVSQLAREFHNMATALLEREKTVEAQKSRLQEQNRLLREIMDLQERLRQAENLAAVGRMSAQVAHEVRNPLHSIGLEAEMAIERAGKSGDQVLKQSLQSILNSVDRLQKITENYLKLTRLSDGQKSVVDLGLILESVLATYAPVCEVQSVEVILSIEEGASLKVWADRDLMEQVLGNLFRNSLQALEGRSGSWIFWSMGNTDAGRFWLRIEDNGPGIAAEIKDRLFTPFVTSRAQGTGLGLSFIKKVLEDHGGLIQNIEPVSKADGAPKSGACFELTLPLLMQEGAVFRTEVVSHVENTLGG